MLAAGALVLVGCGSEDPATGAAEQEAVTSEQTTTVGGDVPGSQAPTSEPPDSESPAVPREVIVCWPGLVDTSATVEDVPAWPGPRPEAFMKPTLASGACGTLTGDEARVVYESALENPRSLIEPGENPRDAAGGYWGLDTVVVWLVVEPVW